MATLTHSWLVPDELHVTTIEPTQGDWLIIDGKRILDSSNRILYTISNFHSAKFLSEEVRVESDGSMRILKKARKYHQDFDKENSRDF